jgi:hypothetical protein
MYSALFEAQRANAELFFRLTCKGIDAFGKMTELAVDSARSTVAVAQQGAVGAISDRGQQEPTAQEIAAALPSPEKAETCTRELFGIASDLQTEVARWTQEQIAAQQQAMRTLIDQMGYATRVAERFSGAARESIEHTSGAASRAAEQFSGALRQSTDQMSDATSRAAGQVSGAMQQGAQEAASAEKSSGPSDRQSNEVSKKRA